MHCTFAFAISPYPRIVVEVRILRHDGELFADFCTVSLLHDVHAHTVDRFNVSVRLLTTILSVSLLCDVLIALNRVDAVGCVRAYIIALRRVQEIGGQCGVTPLRGVLRRLLHGGTRAG